MNDERWLLPEGIDEVLPPEAWRLEDVRRRLLDLFRTWGYELVIPPFIEYDIIYSIKGCKIYIMFVCPCIYPCFKINPVNVARVPPVPGNLARLNP